MTEPKSSDQYETEYLYIGYDLTGLYKIGITKYKDKRLKQLRTANPFFAYLFIFEVKDTAVKEIELHAQFSKKNFRGEWYRLNADDLKYIGDKFFQIDINISTTKKIVEIIKEKKDILLPDGE